MSFSSDPFSSAMMSLPTPPGTSHREEKENRSSFSDAFSSSRVAWSEHNEYHTVVSTLPPKLSVASSVLKKPPTRSILKKTAIPLMPSIDENQREETPEPDDPLVDLHYLEGPISRIIASDALLRDLIEAYSVLAARIRSCMGGSTEGDASWPLFQPLRKHREAFVDAIVRDLGRALEDPLKTAIQPEPEVEHGLAPEEDRHTPEIKGLPSPKDSPKKKKKRGMSEDQVKHARDLCTICHSVLKLLATVFVLPATYQVFSDEQLGRIFTQILAIPLADSLPTPNARKTCALAIWLIQVQRLPECVLEPAKDRIAYALRRGIEGELGKEGKKGSVSDGLKAVHDLSISYPETFIPAFTALLPSIFRSLLAPTLSIRALACNALGGFSLGSASLPTSALHTRIADYVVEYLMAPRPDSPSKRTPTPADDPLIIRTLRTTLKAIDPQHAAQGPVWALCVLANFVVLLRSTTFLDMKLAKCLTALFTLAMRHQKSTIRALACLVWRAMTWAYFQPPPVKLPRDDGDEDDQSDHEDEDPQEGRRRLTAIWKIIHSVVDMGAGVGTIGALLASSEPGDDNHSSVRRGLYVLNLMSKKGGQTCQDALDLACHLTSLGSPSGSDDEPREWSPMKLLPQPLFSSSPGLLTAEYKFLAPVVKPMFELTPQVEDVRWLNEDELSLDWVFDSLIDTWREGLRALRLFWGCSELPEEIRDIWSRLLTAKVYFAMEAGDEEALSRVAECAVEVLIELLEDKDLDLRPCTDNENPVSVLPCSPRRTAKPSIRNKGPSFSRMKPALHLFLVHQLWLIVKELIPDSSLAEAAGKLLAYIQSKEGDILGKGHGADEVHDYYATFCSSVAAVCDISDMEAFWSHWGGVMSEGYKRYDWPVDVRIAIWTQFIRKWEDDKASWEAGIVLLSVPFRQGCGWEMNVVHLNQWDLHLMQTIDRALDCGVDSVAVLDQLSSAIGPQKGGIISSIRVADLILSHLDISEVRRLPGEIFKFVNDTLLRSYPPPTNDLVPSMWLTRSVTRTMDVCPIKVSRSLFEKLQDGLSVWISDEFDVITSEDYAFNILPLYQTLLLGIRSLPTSIDILETFAPVIYSAFCGRLDKHSGMSEAFQEFWETSNYTCLSQMKGLPEKIAFCLEHLHGPPEPPTQDITDMDETDEHITEHMDVDEVEMHLTQPEEEDIASALPLDVDDVGMNPFVPHSIAGGEPESLRTLDKSPKTPRTPKDTSLVLSTPPRPQKNTEPSPAPLLILGNSAPLLPPLLPSSPHTPKRSLPKRHTNAGPVSNKENRSPLPSLLERVASVSPTLPVVTPVQGILGKRRFVEEIEEEEGIPQKRSQGSNRRKSGLANVFKKSLDLPPSDDDVMMGLIKALLPEPAETFPEVETKVDETTPRTQGPPASKSRKRKGVFMEAVEIPALRVVRRRTESLPGPATSTPSGSEDTPRALSTLRRTRSGTRLLGKAATFERLKHTPRKRKRHSSVLPRSEGSTGSSDLTISTTATSSPLRVLRETVIAGSDDSIMLATPTKHSPATSEVPSSDDLAFFGQVTPRRLVSPAMRRIHENMDSDPPSDDSVLNASPSRDRVARRSRFFGSTPAPTTKSRPKTSPLRSSIRRKSMTSLFGVDGETLSY